MDVQRKLLGDLKRFARAEMARDLARRHGREMRLPWDADEDPTPQAAPGEPSAQLDTEALQALSGVLGGD